MDVGDPRPCQWEPHAATLLAWPFNRKDWPGKFPRSWVFVEMIRHCARGDWFASPWVPCSTRYVRGALKRADAAGRVEFLRFRWTGWMRDISPAFVRRPGGLRHAAPLRLHRLG